MAVGGACQFADPLIKAKLNRSEVRPGAGLIQRKSRILDWF
jgi:hypothetical protein